MPRQSTADFTIRQSDTLPRLTANLTDGAGVAVPIPPTATVTFRLRRWGSTVLTVNSATGVVITSTSTGAVRWSPTAAATATTGSYWAEFQVTSATGTRTFPNVETGFWVEITKELG